MPDKQKVLKGREVVDAYRLAHTQLHSKPWHRGIPEEHTPLLEIMVKALAKQGFTSAAISFELKKTEILAKLWDDSNLLNIQELGFKDIADFVAKSKDTDREALSRMWH